MSNATTAPNAGPFDLDGDYKFKCTVRKGDISVNPRGGECGEFSIKISEGLNVVKAKTLHFLRSTLPNAKLISEDLYFKKSKGAAQNKFTILTSENFEELTRFRWNLISQRDVDGWTAEGGSVLDGFCFEIFVYIHRQNRDNQGSGSDRCIHRKNRDNQDSGSDRYIHRQNRDNQGSGSDRYIHRQNRDNQGSGSDRATAGRFEDAAPWIRNYEQENSTQLGPIPQQHLTIHHARQAYGTAFTLPDNNTFRQAQQLDLRRKRRKEAAEDEEPNVKKIRMQINGTWVNVAVDVNSLRLALGLPLQKNQLYINTK